MSPADPMMELYGKFMAANAAEEALAASGQHPAYESADALRRLMNDMKRLSTLRAKAALAGVILQCIDGDFGAPVYVATFGAVTSQLDSLAQAEDWIEAWNERISGGQETH